MKKLFTLFVMVAFYFNVIAQSPQKMSYQAVIRNAANALVTSHVIGMRISILRGSESGTVSYTETQTPTTNVNGLVSIEIGGGTGFDTIHWSNGHYFIKTETDPAGGSSYTITGTSQLLSVPYALYSKTSETASNAVTITGNQTITGIKTFSNDLLINGLTVGLGKGAVSSNTAIGTNALYFNTTGQSNTANGFIALYSNTTGDINTANGVQALYANTTGGYNTANGFSALYLNTTGNANTANGVQALRSNTTGNFNTAIGYYAGFTNSTGNNNVFLGYEAGYWETGSNKLFIDNQTRANESDARAKALIYGIFDADPANQVLTVNGNVGIGTTTPGSKLEVTGQIKITGGTPAIGKVLTSDATGLATWQTPSGGGHFIGESYGGGIVFYVYDNGQHGLIAATADQSTGLVWTNTAFQSTVSNAVRDGVNGGLSNTERIIIQAGAGSYAAQLCANYQGGNYADWYLPSKFELNLLYLQKTVVGGFANSVYWSSTEDDPSAAWYQYFSTGIQYTNDKNATAYVRAIRAF
jgi:hypothetical protein